MMCVRDHVPILMACVASRCCVVWVLPRGPCVCFVVVTLSHCGLRTSPQRLRGRPRHNPEDKSACSVRANGGDASGKTTLTHFWLEAQAMLVSKSQDPDRRLTTRGYSRLVAGGINNIGLEPLKYATHSIRRYAETSIIPSNPSPCSIASDSVRALFGIIFYPAVRQLSRQS
jgi:hypothetical protein